jgi:hypothetical protein
VHTIVTLKLAQQALREDRSKIEVRDDGVGAAIESADRGGTVLTARLPLSI